MEEADSRGKDAQRSGGEALQGLRALSRGIFPSSWPTARLFGADSAALPTSCHLSASRALFEEGLCPSNCGQIPG